MLKIYLQVLLFVLSSTYTYSQSLKFDENPYGVSWSLVSLGIIEKDYNITDKTVMPIYGAGADLTLKLNFRSFTSGLMVHFLHNGVPDSIRDNLYKFEDLKDRLLRFNDPYNFGLVFFKDHYLKKDDYSIAYGLSLGGSTSNFGKTAAPVLSAKNEVMYVTIEPDRSLKNIGYYLSPQVEFRNHFDEKFYLFRKLRFTYRNTSTKMIFSEFDYGNQQLNSGFYTNQIKSTYFDISLGASYNW